MRKYIDPDRRRPVERGKPRGGVRRIWRRVAGFAVVLGLLGGLLIPLPAFAASSGATFYVVNPYSNSVTPINPATGQAGPAIPVGSEPVAIAITPNGETAYVVNLTGSVTPINLATGKAGTSILVGSNPDAIAITPDGQTAYVANQTDNTVTPITLATGQVETPIPVEGGPLAIAIAPNGQTAYVAGYTSVASYITPINLATGKAGAAIAAYYGPDRPFSLAITPDGQTAYVTHPFGNTVTAINLATDRTTAIPVSLPDDLAIAPNGQTAYVLSAGSTSMTPIDVATNRAGATIPLGTSPSGIAIVPGGQTAYVTHAASNTVTSIDLATGQAGWTIPAGSSPAQMAIAPDQAPVARLTVTPAPVGQITSFDASASTDATSAITQYAWNFGDGTTATTTTPSTTHTYTASGTYTVTLTETDAVGTSTQQVFTGQMVLNNGGPSAQVQQTVNVAPALSGLSPGAGPTGTAVTLTGSGFGTTVGAVYWTQNGTTVKSTGSAITVWGDAAISTDVPASLAPGTVTAAVYNPSAGLLSAGASFTVEGVPTIAALSPTSEPASGPVGMPVTLTGQNFGTTVGAVYWTQGSTTVPSVITAWGDQAIQTTVPTGLMPGTVAAAVYDATTGLTGPGAAFTVLPNPGGGGGGGGVTFGGSPGPLPTGPVTLTAGQAGSVAALGVPGRAMAQIPAGALATTTTLALHLGLATVALSAAESGGTPLPGFQRPVTLTLAMARTGAVQDPTAPPIAVVAWNPLLLQWIPVPTATVTGTTVTWTTPQAGTFAVVPVGTVSTVRRLAGATRIETAIQAAKAAYPNGSSTVILVHAGTSGASPDALSAAGLAGALHAPILLTTADTLPSDVLTAIQTLHATTVHIVGGPAAVSQAVVATLESAGLTVAPRLGGRDRYATALSVDQYLTTDHLTAASTVFVANGATLVDALSASPVLAAQGAPLLLAAPGQTSLSAEQNAWLKQAGMTHVVIFGGAAAVSAALQTAVAALPGITVARLAGATRNATAVAIDQQYFPHPTGVVVAANGTAGGSVVDALGAAPFAGEYGLPLVLTNPGSVPASTSAYLHSNAPLGGIWVLGGTQAVAPVVAAALGADVPQS